MPCFNDFAFSALQIKIVLKLMALFSLLSFTTGRFSLNLLCKEIAWHVAHFFVILMGLRH